MPEFYEQQKQQEQERHPYRRDDRAWRAEQDKVKAALLLERLRYKWWQRQGTLGSFMQRVGDFGRTNGIYIVAAAYFLFVALMFW